MPTIIVKAIFSRRKKMSIREIDTLFNRGLEMMNKGNFREAEVLFEKAKKMTVDMSKK
jgi:outer membrane protein assembly factor BamD (BamD/ComL family)